MPTTITRVHRKTLDRPLYLAPKEPGELTTLEAIVQPVPRPVRPDLANGRLICVIGIAPVKPAEFVIFRIQQKTLELDAS